MDGRAGKLGPGTLPRAGAGTLAGAGAQVGTGGRAADRNASKAGTLRAATVRAQSRAQALAEARGVRLRGGDTDAPVSAPGGGRGCANLRVHLTCGGYETCVPTRDPSDRAHAVRGPDGLLSAREVPNARPRMYPPSQMTNAGVSWDSAFDATERVRRELDGVPGIGASDCEPAGLHVRDALARLEARVGAARARNLLRGMTR